MDPTTSKPKIVIPPFLSHLPTDRGYPVPHFVAWVDGKPEFRCVDGPKTLAIAKALDCWVCGKQYNGATGDFRLPRWFLGGPITIDNGYSTEGPMHEACARYSLATCPYLLGNMDRREAGMPEGHYTAAGAVRERPPVILLVYADAFGAKTQVQNGHRFAAWEILAYRSCEYFVDGQPIAEAEALRLRDRWALWRRHLSLKAEAKERNRKRDALIRERDKRLKRKTASRRES